MSVLSAAIPRNASRLDEDEDEGGGGVSNADEDGIEEDDEKDRGGGVDAEGEECWRVFSLL